MHHNDNIIFIALNRSDTHEADELRNNGSVIIPITGADRRGRIRIGSRTFTLSNDGDHLQFMRQLRVGSTQTSLVEEAVGRSRNHVAQLAAVWALAERGGIAASRLVISGHHSGGGLFGAKGPAS